MKDHGKAIVNTFITKITHFSSFPRISFPPWYCGCMFFINLHSKIRPLEIEEQAEHLEYNFNFFHPWTSSNNLGA